MKLQQSVKEKQVLFITTKNIDYIRNTQEIRKLREWAADVDIIYSDKKNYVARIIEVWRKINKKKVAQSDVIFVGFAPQLVIPFVGWKLKNKPIIMDFFISVYDTLVCDRKKIKKNSLAAKFCHQLDERTLKKATHVITDTKAHAGYFISEFNGTPEKFETIYLEADPNIYYPRPQKKTEELKDKFVVLYFGSILPLQGVEIVLESIRKLKDREDIYFDIIGPIPAKYNKPIQTNVNYTEWLEQEKLAEHIANADLCLAGHFSGDIDKGKRTIPGKAYIYEMMEKKMVLGDGEANHELFIADGRHYFVQMGDPDKIKDLILKLQKDGREYGKKDN